MKYYILSFCLLILSTLGQAAIWVTNKDHSEIMFQVPYMGVSELTGRFNEFTGEVNLLDHRPVELTVLIRSASIDTGNKMRDGHLKGKDFFQSGQHQNIQFKSTKITSSGKGHFKADGMLSIRGVAKPSIIEFSMSDSLKDTWGYENKFVKFKSSLNREDFGINWNKTLDGKELLIGNKISYLGTFQIQPATNKTPNSKHMIPDTEYIRQRDLERTEEESFISRKLRKLINGK
jgi:polyisoprenoid-binding protein YceI